MAKFISASFVLVLLVMAKSHPTMMNGTYSAAREDDMEPLPPTAVDKLKLCDLWHRLCLADPKSFYCGEYEKFCSKIAPSGSDSPPIPENTLP
jgi:hypothetical protein